MENLTKNNDYNNLHIQHTYYIDSNFITGLFREYRYKLNNIYNFENNSVFYHFVKDDSCSDVMTIHDFKNVALIQSLKNFYLELVNKIQAIVIDNPFYICPSGFYGKVVYYYLNQKNKNNVLGFLDSDKTKINKRLVGTTCTIFNKNYIQNIDNVTILIIAEKYKNEIVDELLTYNTKIEFIYI